MAFGCIRRRTDGRKLIRISERNFGFLLRIPGQRHADFEGRGLRVAPHSNETGRPYCRGGLRRMAADPRDARDRTSTLLWPTSHAPDAAGMSRLHALLALPEQRTP